MKQDLSTCLEKNQIAQAERLSFISCDHLSSRKTDRTETPRGEKEQRNGVVEKEETERGKGWGRGIKMKIKGLGIFTFKLTSNFPSV